jgi:cysteinyl-tRNA synthetase
MDDDFNTPQALAVLFDFGRNIEPWLQPEKNLSAATLQAILDFYQHTGEDILGLLPAQTASIGQSDLVENLMQLMLDLRAQARKTKNWEMADQIRQRLNAFGIILEDHAQGTHWKLSLE